MLTELSQSMTLCHFFDSTRSDVLGHMFTMVGKDWTHAGVANLYTNICQNGYRILYLTSRAIGQVRELHHWFIITVKFYT